MSGRLRPSERPIDAIAAIVSVCQCHVCTCVPTVASMSRDAATLDPNWGTPQASSHHLRRTNLSDVHIKRMRVRRSTRRMHAEWGATKTHTHLHIIMQSPERVNIINSYYVKALSFAIFARTHHQHTHTHVCAPLCMRRWQLTSPATATAAIM